jgi:hypothetical protein
MFRPSQGADPTASSETRSWGLPSAPMGLHDNSKLRLLGFVNSAFSGRYREATEQAAAIAGLDPTDAIVADRAGRIKYGYVFERATNSKDGWSVTGRLQGSRCAIFRNQPHRQGIERAAFS